MIRGQVGCEATRGATRQEHILCARQAKVICERTQRLVQHPPPAKPEPGGGAVWPSGWEWLVAIAAERSAVAVDEPYEVEAAEVGRTAGAAGGVASAQAVQGVEAPSASLQVEQPVLRTVAGRREVEGAGRAVQANGATGRGVVQQVQRHRPGS
eukprot:4725135-Prymnesium_polylepis.2